jgi:anti-sigma28 factor (negative regulator of flagellin synthesis)
MSHVASTSNVASPIITRSQAAVTRSRSAPSAPPADRVEVSASHMPAGAADDDAMERRIAEIRAQIADGTYVTPDKLDVVVERMLADLARQPE